MATFVALLFADDAAHYLFPDSGRAPWEPFSLWPRWLSIHRLYSGRRAADTAHRGGGGGDGPDNLAKLISKFATVEQSAGVSSYLPDGDKLTDSSSDGRAHPSNFQARSQGLSNQPC